jgi:hypothetical protein
MEFKMSTAHSPKMTQSLGQLTIVLVLALFILHHTPVSSIITVGIAAI